MAAHPEELDAYRGGKKALFGLRALKGQGGPKVITATLRAKLDGWVIVGSQSPTVSEPLGGDCHLLRGRGSKRCAVPLAAQAGGTGP